MRKCLPRPLAIFELIFLPSIQCAATRPSISGKPELRPFHRICTPIAMRINAESRVIREGRRHSVIQQVRRDRGVLAITELGKEIGIGGTVTRPPLPHHRTCGSAYGGSVS